MLERLKVTSVLEDQNVHGWILKEINVVKVTKKHIKSPGRIRQAPG